MKLSFYGAAKAVTGSCHCVEACGKTILIDCGMQQGQDETPDQQFPFRGDSIDFVLITHAHIDHSGRLPLLVKRGFSGKIFTTGPTVSLLSIMLRDSAHIQQMDTEWQNRKMKRSGNSLIEPLYTIEDADKVQKLITGCRYNEVTELAPGIKFRFTDAGHLLGSSFVELWLEENGISKKIVFSGDIGNLGQPIIRDPQYIKEADYAVMESTYGDRNHEASPDYTADLALIIDKTLAGGGNVIIPSFAIGRTQELLYFIRDMKERKLVKSVPDFPVFVDSPLAVEATRIYSGDLTGYIDEETISVIKNGYEPLSFSNLSLCESSDQSKKLNEDLTPKVIISASGMCDAGRIRHHLKHNIWRPECALVFVGYQANGTLGRILLDGAKKVKLLGEEIVVRCSVHNFRGLSAHADKNGLMKWVSSFEPKPQMVFSVHGETEVCSSFVSYLSENGFNASAPSYMAVFDLAANAYIDLGSEPVKVTVRKKAQSPAFERLLAAGKRLLEVISRNEGSSNKELAKFTDQIDALSKKWDR